MLRASSEMAVATSVAWPAENPNCSAMTRPSRRATTRSLSDLSGTRISISSFLSEATSAAMPGFLLLIEICQTFLKVQRGRNILQRNPKLHHGEGHLRLDAHDHGLRAAQADH